MTNKKITTIFLFIVFIINCIIQKNGVLIGDEIYFHFLYEKIDLFKNFFYGTWVVNLQNILMFYIPHISNIHIQDWACTFGTIFKSGIITSIIFLFMKLMSLQKIKKSLQIMISTIILLSIYIYFQKLMFIDFIIYEGFFRFIIPAFLLLIFSYQLYKFLLNKNNNNLPLYVLAFITACSSEVAPPILFIMSLSTTLYVLKNKDKKQNHTMINLLLCILAGSAFLLSTKGFQINIQDKLENNKHIIPTLTIFCDFTKQYIQSLILNFKFYYLTFLAIILINYRSNYGTKTSIIFPFIIILSILGFSFSLIFFGKNPYNQNFWITHTDIYSIFIPLFIFAICIPLNEFIANTQQKYKKVTTQMLFILFLILIIPFYNSAKQLINTNLNIKEHSYYRDKIRMFYYYKNEEPIMPSFSDFGAFFSLINTNRIAFGENNTSDNNIPKHNDKLEQNYFNTLYCLNLPKDYYQKITYKEDKYALKIFKEKGGTTYETYTKNYKFSKLNNKNFVLNIEP